MTLKYFSKQLTYTLSWDLVGTVSRVGGYDNDDRAFDWSGVKLLLVKILVVVANI